MGVDTRAHFIQVHPGLKELQLWRASFDMGRLPDEITDVFKPVGKKDICDFYVNNKHYTKRFRDMYGEPLNVATLDDVYDAIVKYKGDYCDYCDLFAKMAKMLYKDNPRIHYLVFTENY